MSSPPTRIHFGRGGAGNTVSSTATDDRRRRPSHASEPLQEKSRSARRFSTGIGGQGNITRAGSSEEETKALMDNDAPGLVLSSSPRTTYGITGAGNVYKASEADIESARANNDGLRRASLATIGDRGRRSSSSSKTDPSEMPSETNGSIRRGSLLVTSVRDFLDRRGSRG